MSFEFTYKYAQPTKGEIFIYLLVNSGGLIKILYKRERVTNNTHPKFSSICAFFFIIILFRVDACVIRYLFKQILSQLIPSSFFFSFFFSSTWNLSHCLKENYQVLREYIKCVLPPLTEVVGPIINLINETYNFCERREYAFNVLPEYNITIYIAQWERRHYSQ